MEFRQEPEIVNPAEIEVYVSTICDLGAARPISTEKPSERPETVSKYALGDRPERTITFPYSISSEMYSGNSPHTSFHTIEEEEYDVCCEVIVCPVP